MIKVDSFSFQGVNGAYSEQAGKNIFPNAKSMPCATFEDMFEHVRSGKSKAAMVPKFLTFETLVFFDISSR